MKPRGPKVLLAMSGGVDSSVAAGLLVRAGYEVVGCFMRLGSPGEPLEGLVPYEEAACGGGAQGRARIGHQGCCSINDAADARLVAAELAVPFYVCNFKKDFGRIVEYFAQEYAAGRTPNPCVRCNDWLKFGRLDEYGRQIGAQFIATGHYARVERRRGGPVLMRGVDTAKDQSYVLFGVQRERLGRMLLPIGGLAKARVRELAREMGLPVFDKPDSQEICFVPDNDYAGLLERRRPELAEQAGELVTADGRVVGRHAGQHRFTIGQRRGVGVALGYPLYVVSKDPRTRRVVLGPREELAASCCIAGEANWLVEGAVPSCGGAGGGWRACVAKHRAHGEPAAAEYRGAADVDGATPSGRVGAFEVRFEVAQEAVAPGQAIVVYDADEPDVVLGGGWVRSVGNGAKA